MGGRERWEGERKEGERREGERRKGERRWLGESRARANPNFRQFG